MERLRRGSGWSIRWYHGHVHDASMTAAKDSECLASSAGLLGCDHNVDVGQQTMIIVRCAGAGGKGGVVIHQRREELDMRGSPARLG